MLFLIIGTINLLYSGPQYWPAIFLQTFVFTTACAFFCTLLFSFTIEFIYGLPRPLFYSLFTIIVIAGVFLGVMTATLILYGTFSVRTDILIFSTVMGIVTSVVITSYFIIRENLEKKITQLKNAEIENERLKRIEIESRLNSLQSKMNPHFLFNTLNSTAALIYDDPKKAEESIVQLSELYQKVLSVSRQTFIHLSEEIELMKDYLELEKLRFDEQLTYHITCGKELLNIKIPGLLIEPLVENVVKHAQNQSENPAHIDVRIEKKQGSVFIEVKDNGPGFDIQKASFGFGLFSIQERLKLIYRKDYDFDIRSEAQKGTIIKIRLPVKSG